MLKHLLTDDQPERTGHLNGGVAEIKRWEVQRRVVLRRKVAPCR